MKILCLLLLASCARVHADVHVQASDRSGETEMFMNSEFVRINVGGVNQSVLYSVQADAFQHLNHDQRSYMEIDQQAIENLSEALHAAMSQVQELMAGLPEPQREQMAKIIGSPPDKDSVKGFRQIVSNTGKTMDVNGVPCEQYTVALGDEIIAEMWVASLAALEVSESDVRGFRKLSAFQERMMAAFEHHQFAKKNTIPAHYRRQEMPESFSLPAPGPGLGVE